MYLHKEDDKDVRLFYVVLLPDAVVNYYAKLLFDSPSCHNVRTENNPLRIDTILPNPVNKDGKLRLSRRPRSCQQVARD